MAVIAAWIGHKDATLTMRLYAHSQDEALKDRRSNFESSCDIVVTLRGLFERLRTVSTQVRTEPMTGIEPAYSAWEADVLPLNYIGAVASEG